MASQSEAHAAPQPAALPVSNPAASGNDDSAPQIPVQKHAPGQRQRKDKASRPQYQGRDFQPSQPAFVPQSQYPQPSNPTQSPDDDPGYDSTGTVQSTQSRSRSRRRRRSRHRNQGPTSSDPLPPLPGMASGLPLHQTIGGVLPAGKTSSTYNFPYASSPADFHAMMQQYLAQYPQYAPTPAPGAGSGVSSFPSPPSTPPEKPNQQVDARPREPAIEHPVQVPVRVVNPEEVASPRGKNFDKDRDGSRNQGNLRLRLDLNLEIEVKIEANIRGSLELALL